MRKLKKLANLSNSLLDLAKSENALGSPELIDISEIIKEVIGQYSRVAKAKQVKIFIIFQMVKR